MILGGRQTDSQIKLFQNFLNKTIWEPVSPEEPVFHSVTQQECTHGLEKGSGWLRTSLLGRAGPVDLEPGHFESQACYPRSTGVWQVTGTMASVCWCERVGVYVWVCECVQVCVFMSGYKCAICLSMSLCECVLSVSENVGVGMSVCVCVYTGECVCTWVCLGMSV